MPIEPSRAASRHKTQAPSLLKTVGRTLTAALALGSAKAMADTLAPAHAYSPALAPAPGAPLPTPAAPGAIPAPNVPGATPVAPSVIMQSFYAGLSEGLAQSGANNSFYVRQSGLGGQSFGLLFTDGPAACGTLSNATATLPAPSIEICSSAARGGSPAVAGVIIDPTHAATNATGVSFTNGLSPNGTESGTVHFTTVDGFPIAFNYSAQPCDTLVLPATCGGKR